MAIAAAKGRLIAVIGDEVNILQMILLYSTWFPNFKSNY
jgi:hypothetical protein